MNSQDKSPLICQLKPGWNSLGIVETIFEDENEDETEDMDSHCSSPLSFAISTPSPRLATSVIDAWTLATGRQPDVKIHVQGTCFQLHKEILVSKSSYMKYHLFTVSEITLSLKVTSDTFKQVTDFCYTSNATITPSNVAALRTAAELLKMSGYDNLCEMTESYFCNLLLLENKEFISEVFQSSLTLLPEAEQTAFITSRCLEALLDSSDVGYGDSDGVVRIADGLKMVTVEEFRVVVESMQQRLTRTHDPLYNVIDLYFLVNKAKNLTEEQKTQLCSPIDCSILSTPVLLQAVQNTRMPLRFIVQAMLIDQLNTHRSIFSALNTNTDKHHVHPSMSESPATLGAILERDAALRQVSHMRAVITKTCSRIQSLEKELSSMKKLLGEHYKQDDGKSASFRLSTNHKVERGERGSVSSSMVRLFGGANSNVSKDMIDGSTSSLSSYLQADNDYESPKDNVKRSFKQRFMKGIKNAFRGSNNSKAKKGVKLSSSEDDSYKVFGYDGERITFDTFAISNSDPHHRSLSVT